MDCASALAFCDFNLPTRLENAFGPSGPASAEAPEAVRKIWAKGLRSRGSGAARKNRVQRGDEAINATIVLGVFINNRCLDLFAD